MLYEDAIQILDLVESGVIMLDQNQQVIFWNRFISDTSLIKFPSIENKPWLDIFPMLEGSRIDKAVQKAVNFNFPSILSYKLLKTQFPLYRKSLATRPPYLIVQSIIVKPLIENNINKGCIIYINDVSAAANREKELNQQTIALNQTIQRYKDVKSRLEQVFDSTHNGIIIFDLEGKIANVNHAAMQMFESTQDELLNKDIATLLPKLKENYFNQNKGQYCYSANANHEFDQPISLATDKFFSVSVSQLNEQQQGEFFVFISDITQRKQAENKLRSVNAELEEFAYRTSHDLRSPIVSSLGLAKVADQNLKSGNIAVAQDCLGHIESSLSKLETLIKDILKLTEMENAEESEELVNIPATLDHIFSSMSHLDGFEHIERRTSLDEAAQIYVKPSRFNMILENLISNALKYHDPECNSPYIHIETYSQSSDFVLDVKDNGLGITKENEHKLFKMFNRFHPKVAFGSGLGLYLIQKSAQVLGGNVRYIAQDKGACFRLTIPHQQSREH